MKINPTVKLSELHCTLKFDPRIVCLIKPEGSIRSMVGWSDHLHLPMDSRPRPESSVVDMDLLRACVMVMDLIKIG